jgi:hypothetical protein
MADRAFDLLVNLISEYVEQRDSYVKRFKFNGNGMFNGRASAIGFARQNEAFARRLLDLLPAMTPAQLEGMAEMVNLALGERRKDMVAGN